MSENRSSFFFILVGLVTVTILALAVCAEGSWASDTSLSTQDFFGAISGSSSLLGASSLGRFFTPDALAPPPQLYVPDVGLSPLKAPAPADFDPGSSFTVEGWIFRTADTPYAWIMGKALPIVGGGRSISYGLYLDGSGGKVAVETPNWGFTTPDPIPLRVWTHVAVTFGNGKASLLVNGVEVASNGLAGTVPAAPTVPFGVGDTFGVGGEPNHSSEAGLYARQVRFWNVARSPAQIIAAMGETLPTDRAGLVSDWPLDERGGSTARDISGNSRALSTSVLAAAHLKVLDSGPYFAQTFTPANLGFPMEARDSAVLDFDGDGDLDLVVAQVHFPPTYPPSERRLLAFRNNNGTFVDATDAVLGSVMMTHPRHLWVADFNRDGRPDLLLGGTGTDTAPAPGEQSRLLIQSVDGRLVDESATRLPAHTIYTHGLAVGDFDNDGDLDFYMVTCCGGTGSRGPFLEVNNGIGLFSDGIGRLPSDVTFETRPGLSACFVDANNDGSPDLVLGASPGANFPNDLLMNDGTGHFVRYPAFTLPPKLFGDIGESVSIVSSDMNGDGYPDLILSADNDAHIAGLQLLLNDGAGHFRDASSQLNVTFPATDEFVYRIEVVDINGDGLPDIVLRMSSTDFRTINFSRAILLNRGGAVFVDASEVFWADTNSSLSVGDFDRDGLMDLLIASSDPNQSGIRVFRGVKRLNASLFEEAPLITSQPVGQTVVAGGSATFSAASSGFPNPSFQWQKNGVNITGATNTTYTIASVSVNDAGTYTVVVTNSVGTVTSNGAILNVTAPPASLDGRVVTPDARGLRSATVTLTNSQGAIRSATTSSFGFFSFQDVAGGDTYTIRVASRLYRFAPRTFQVAGNLTLADFVGLE